MAGSCGATVETENIRKSWESQERQVMVTKYPFSFVSEIVANRVKLACAASELNRGLVGMRRRLKGETDATELIMKFPNFMRNIHQQASINGLLDYG